jgi:hypothetical protein
MNLEQFLRLGDRQVAEIVAAHGPRVVVCPINGTRRWYYLEHPDRYEDLDSHYLDVIAARYIEVFKLFFDHGVHTLLTPAFGPDLLERDPTYLGMAAQGLGRIAAHSDFTDFYQEYDLSVRVYGDYERYFDRPDFHYLNDLFHRMGETNHSAPKRRLFWGLFAHDATETIAGLAVEFFQEHGRKPTRQEIVSAYYGEFVENVDLFIGFDKFSAFDMPLISVGSENLYFMASPTPYLERDQLRRILYDHIYQRPLETSYHEMEREGLDYMRAFYQRNRSTVFGLGRLRNGIWYPGTLSEEGKTNGRAN